jgi:murein DD-endopeptidase
VRGAGVPASARGALDLCAVALCLWAAVYHTPAGALTRDAVARLRGLHATSRPLLAYYSGGVYDASGASPPAQASQVRADLGLVAAVPPGTALARGAFAVYLGLDARGRRAPEAGAAAHHVTLATVDEAQALLRQDAEALGSDDAAVLALFAGEDLARWAVRRARAEARSTLSLEVLAPQLPPTASGAVASAAQALTLATAWGLGWPVAPGTPVSSPFGWREHPLLGRAQLHTGVDLAVAEGTPVRAAAAGLVTRASEDAVNGRMVIVDHGRGVATAYCHNSRLLVAPGQRVEAGALVAESGTTGRSTGPHLHYQLELGQQPVDPLLFRGSTPPREPRRGLGPALEE